MKGLLRTTGGFAAGVAPRILREIRSGLIGVSLAHQRNRLLRFANWCRVGIEICRGGTPWAPHVLKMAAPTEGRPYSKLRPPPKLAVVRGKTLRSHRAQSQPRNAQSSPTRVRACGKARQTKWPRFHSEAEPRPPPGA